MRITDLTELLLSQEEQEEMQESLHILENHKYSLFYEKNPHIVNSILFVEDADEFADFSRDSHLDAECFCFAFLCAKKYGIQIGGYEDDLSDILTDYFERKGLNCSEIADIINREKIFTDYGDTDNFRQAITAINRVLDVYNIQIAVFQDSLYCDCEYTLLAVSKSLANELLSEWESGNFEIYA